MIALIRFYTIALALPAALATLAITRPGWLEVIGIELPAELPAEGEFMQAPSEASIVIEKRCWAKARVIARLRAGQITLFEAASWFQHINQEPPDLAHQTMGRFSGATAEEQVCQQVICYMKSEMNGTAPNSEIEAAITRLETELAKRLCECGRIVLPPLR